MATVKEKKAKTVFGLDIGTRSIVGTVGYLAGGKFHVLAQRIMEHETRAMMEGQIHDIAKVGATILSVKEALEKDLGETLSDVCIAAAGRVLRTVTTHVEMHFEGERNISQDDLYELSMMGVQKAYEEFGENKDSDMRFYCVGYTVMHYYINGYQISNPDGHKAGKLAADLIATFLPDDVVDGLYKAVEIAGLRVANLTLEPIAAIQVAIPEKFRLLNMALVDVGAGTSDICITKDGTIVAYGMIPVAGDHLTDCIVQRYLVDFDTAEQMKRALGEQEEITFKDIMGLSKTVPAAEVLEVLDSLVDEMTHQVAERIEQLNGDKPVSAVFVVGGGGIIPGYTQKLAKALTIPEERVAVRGKEVMQNISFEIKNARQDSMMVTPIGICYSYYEQSNNFIFVEFNGMRIKIYDNGKITVADAAIQAQFPNEDLFAKRGDSLTYMVNGRSGMTRGTLGEPCEITVNGSPADLYSQIRNNDRVSVKPSSKGDGAIQELGKLPEMRGELKFKVNGNEVSLQKPAEVNGAVQTVYYKIQNDDVITIRNWYTVSEISTFLDTPLGGTILVNGVASAPDTRIYDSFEVDWDPSEPLQVPAVEKKQVQGSWENLAHKIIEGDIPWTPDEELPFEDDEELPFDSNETGNEEDDSMTEKESADRQKTASDKTAKGAETSENKNPIPDQESVIIVAANGNPVRMHGKKSYVYVDIFDYIDFDLKTPPKGKSIVTKLNDRKAEYMEELHDGDKIEIYWG